jgi:hypothetical protein
MTDDKTKGTMASDETRFSLVSGRFDAQETAQVAARALKDPAFAQEILEGKYYNPIVRDAILADLAEANIGITSEDLRKYIEAGPKPGGQRLHDLVSLAMGW